MIHRPTLLGLAVFLLLAAGCRGASRCPAPCDPLREVGVDCRSLRAQDAAGLVEGRQVFLDMTVARMPEARVSAALGADCPRHAGSPVTVSAERARDLVAGWRRDSAVEITSAPKVLALPGQEATLFVGETVGFGRTVATEAEEIVEGATMDGYPIRYGRTTAATNQDGGLTFSIEEDPHSPVHLGMTIAVVAEPSADGRRVALDLHGSWREPTREVVPDMGAAEFERHVREHRLDTRFEMPSDGWVLVGNPEWIETDAGRLLQVVLLHTVVLDGGETIPTR